MVPGVIMPRKEVDVLHRGYRIKWGGWRYPTNQALIIGAWFARKSPEDKIILFATTAGCMGFLPRQGYFMTDIHESGFYLDVFSTAVDRERAKHWALAMITELINERSTGSEKMQEGSSLNP
jgi:hypothetical protein